MIEEVPKIYRRGKTKTNRRSTESEFQQVSSLPSKRNCFPYDLVSPRRTEETLKEIVINQRIDQDNDNLLDAINEGIK